MEKITKESKRCFSHGFTVPEETESKSLPLAAPAIATAPPREIDDFIPLLQRKRIGINILKWETLNRKCIIYIFSPTRAWKERMTLH
jgi:hypothetical protein